MRNKIRKAAFTAERDGLRIAGTKFVPEHGGSGIPVILSHGFLGTRDSMANYAEQFAAWGYTAYTFDFIGGAPKNDSDGDMTQMTLLTEKEDLFAVMNYVRQDGCRYEELILMGGSQGGFVSALAAAERRDEVKKLILFFPALCIPDHARSGALMFFRFDPANVPEILSSYQGDLKLSRRFVETTLPIDAFRAIAPYDGDVLIVHGTADEIVKLSYSERACESFSGRAQLFPIQKAGHGFTAEEDVLAMQAVRQFLLGREEVLTVDVRLTGVKDERKGAYSILTIPFEGSAKGPCFEGVIQPGAADIQKFRAGKPVEFCARYRIKGADCAGQGCTVEICNRSTDGIHWMPKIQTDSETLSFYNGAACEAVVEGREIGPIVHIFAEKRLRGSDIVNSRGSSFSCLSMEFDQNT